VAVRLPQHRHVAPQLFPQKLQKLAVLGGVYQNPAAVTNEYLKIKKAIKLA
jgi:hypothetical protein